MAITNEFSLKEYIKVLENTLKKIDARLDDKVITKSVLKEYKDRLISTIFKKFSLDNLTKASDISNPYKQFPKIKWQKFDRYLNIISGKYKNSIQIIKLGKNKFAIFPNVIYASPIEFGAVIKPKTASYLVIPLNPEFYKTSPRQHKLIKVRKILYKKISKNKYRPAYLLTKQVRIRKHLTWKISSKKVFEQYILTKIQYNFWNTLGKWLIGE